MTIKDFYKKVVVAVRSPRGRNFFVFLVFLIIAAFLWWVIALNDEGQTDVRMPVRINHVPDSVTIVSSVPPTITVNVRARGSQLLKYAWGSAPTFNIDFRMYRNSGVVRLTEADVKSVARQALNGASVVLVSPDSLNIAYTSRPPVIVPVRPECTVTVAPQVTLAGTPVVEPDSVKIFTAGRPLAAFNEVTTEPLVLSDLKETVTRRVRVIAPPRSRAIPDSVDVTISVEPLILKTRRVPIEANNVPAGLRLITFPTAVDVMYMIPVSDYIDSDPKIRVVADYNSAAPDGKMRIRIAEASENLRNVYLDQDSVEYIIERLK